jgi:hypothetical protein
MIRILASTARFVTFAAVGTIMMASQVRPAQAQSNATYIASIPFEFQMNDKIHPAGSYQIQQVSSHTLRLSTVGGRHIGDVPVYPGDDARNGKAQIRFNKYGDVYFLREFAAQADGSRWHSVSRCSTTPGEKKAAHDWVQTKQTFTVALNAYPQR